MADEIPSVTQELERKTLDFLESIVWKTEAGRMSQHDRSLMALSVWTVTSGLVSNDISALATQASEGCAEQKMLKRMFVGKGCVVSIEWPAESDGYRITKQDSTTRETKLLRESNADLFAKYNEIRAFCNSMWAANYTEIPSFQN